MPELQEQGIEIVELTVDDHSSVRKCFEAVQGELNGAGLDFLINNAGKGVP